MSLRENTHEMYILIILEHLSRMPLISKFYWILLLFLLQNVQMCV